MHSHHNTKDDNGVETNFRSCLTLNHCLIVKGEVQTANHKYISIILVFII
jgi:hypothetical protein